MNLIFGFMNHFEFTTNNWSDCDRLICPPCTDHNCKDGRISGGLFWLLSSVVSQKLSGTFKCARNDLFKCYQTIGTTRHLIFADPKKKTFTRSDISID